jgi:Ca-activated chloride channel family protein
MNFASPEFFALALLLVPIIWLAGKRRGTLGHTQVGLHTRLRTVPLLGRVPSTLLIAFWLVLVAALAGPQLTEYSEKTTVKTRNYLLDVDVSGSMDSKLTVKNQQDFTPAKPAATTDGAQAQEPKPPTRADAAQAGAALFVESPSRKGDRVGLMLFNDQPYYVWPLTLDLETIKRKLYLIVKYNAGGTNFSGPDESNQNIGGIQGGINHLLEITKPDETRVLIMVTDGEDSINEKRFGELVALLKKEHIKLYVLGVGESWGSGTKPDLQRLAEEAGGLVIPVGDTQAMQDGFATIDRLEKTTAQVDPVISQRDISEWFLGLAVILALLYLGSIVLVRDDA